MAPITAIIDKTSADDSVIKLIYATGKAQLGLSLWSGTKDADPEAPIQPPQEVGNGQYILNPSQMASINFQGVERVFTLTTENPFKVTPQDFHNISEISESKQKTLASVPIGNTTLAACRNEDNAWVYYSNGRCFMEYNLQTSQRTELAGTFGLWINSFAAAYYDPATDRRCLIYETSSLVEFVVGSDQPASAIQQASDMQRNTPVGVVFENGKVFLYYCGRGDSGGIRRTIKTENGWQNSTLIDSRTISQDSQLTVVRANGINHLFFVARDQTEDEEEYFVHYPDEIS
ncbi:hypothetical protein J7337_010241 [Fusarium musae]|uniref:Fucose-specific lectin n=1 Tax=Fusarium musae TaxID=1042133 RepID=A0A9P8D8U1_9HYPO|nr:hypothetical protein J7337_010241 [Fusarium musae]KAG9497381.1 hypothetical protein J7337_010241 [Fusarium musae]